MNKRATLILCACLSLGFIGSAADPVFAEGSNPFNMMNPSRWFGGKNQDYDDYYDSGYGPYGRPGYGMPYGPPGFAPPHGFPPGYGYGVPQAPQAYAPAQAPAPVAPQQADDGSATRIRELEERIRQLEASQQPAPQPGMPSRQETNNLAVPQPPSAPSTWQGSTDMPATQAPMPPAWQRSAGSNPKGAPASPSWKGSGDVPQVPASPAPLEGDIPEQKHRFRPF